MIVGIARSLPAQVPSEPGAWKLITLSQQESQIDVDLYLAWEPERPLSTASLISRQIVRQLLAAQ